MREFPQWEVDSLDSMGGTALSYATFLGGGDPNTITKAMLELKGVSDAAVNNLGATLLHCAAGNPDARAGLMRTLLKRPGLKATVNMPMLPRNFKFRMVYRVSRFAVRALGSNNGVFKNFRACYKQTPLHCAARWGNLEVVKVLIGAGADCGAKDGRGLTPMEAARVGFGGEVPEALAGALLAGEGVGKEAGPRGGGGGDGDGGKTIDAGDGGRTMTVVARASLANCTIVEGDDESSSSYSGCLEDDNWGDLEEGFGAVAPFCDSDLA